MSDRPKSADGLIVLDPWTSITLRALAQSGNTALSAETAVAGFGPFRELAVELLVTAVSFTGGVTPTAQLKAWIQRQLPSGAWDDLLAFQTAALASVVAPGTAHAGHYRAELGPALAPVAAQDCGGSPPFSQRSGWLSESMRVKHQLVLGGGTAPTAALLTWSLVVLGRP